MKRRDFMQNTMLSGTATLLANLIAAQQASAQQKNRTLTLDGEYYRHYPVDFAEGKEGAIGFKGWGGKEEITVSADETAIIPMHIWNIDISPELPFTSEGPAGGVMDMLEWASRSAPIIKTVIPPVLEAARKAGIPVIHVASDENYAIKYPGYGRAVRLAGPEPAGPGKAPKHAIAKSPDDRKDELLFGKRFAQAIDYYSERIDFPPQAKPLDNEYVVLTEHELTEVLRSMGVWNLIYIGFAINWCLWFSPCGMTDMSRLGYRCNCIKECVTAVENRESVRGEFNKHQALWRTSLMFGYIHSAEDFITACGRIKPKKS